jgi:hypothetical protein
VETPKLSVVHEILTLPYGRGWGYKSSKLGLKILVYGTFRNNYRIISTLAEILADHYSQTLFLPVIMPVRKPIWQNYLYKDESFIGLLARQSVLIYSRYHRE